MDENQSRALLEQLGEHPDQQALRMVLTMKGAPATPESELSPDQFSTRQAYREALIARRVGSGADQVSEAAQRFRSIGLKVRPGALTQSIVVEGSPNLLAEAMRDEEVVDATFDEEISLIRPERYKGTETR